MQEEQGIEMGGDEDAKGEGQQGQGSNGGAIETIRVHGPKVTPKQFVGQEQIADATFSPAVLLLKELGIFIRSIGPAACLRIHIGVIAQKKGVMGNVSIFTLHDFDPKPVPGQNLWFDLLE